MTRKQLFILVLAFLAGCCLSRFVSAQEIEGPLIVKPGLPAVFELPTKAAWVVTPVDQASDKFLVDSSGTKIFFASPTEGQFTIVAAFAVDSEITQAVHVFNVSSKASPTPGPKPEPQPEPTPEPETLKAWVAKNVPDDKDRATKAANVFMQQADGLNRNLIRSTDAAYYGVRKGLQPIAVTEQWQSFQKSLNEKLAESMAAAKLDNPILSDKEALRLAFVEISQGLQEAAK